MKPPFNLKCEYLTNPQGIDCLTPRFSWIAEHAGRNQQQQAYQILVSSSPELAQQETSDIRDSGRIEDSRTYNIRYAGAPLQRDTDYYWRVRWWDASGEASPYSEPASFSIGLIDAGDWQAHWISKKDCTEFTSRGSEILGKNLEKYFHAHAIYLRKEFRLKAPVRRAVAYLCGLGFYEFHLNGEKVGVNVLDPAQTDYRKIALYSTYNVTEQLRESNTVGVILGNGRFIRNYGYSHLKLIFQLHIEYETGEREIIISGEDWKCSHGPLMENGIYFGERYDARREFPGWDSPGFDDSAWQPAIRMETTPLRAQMMPPVRVTGYLLPQKIWSPEAGIYIVDFGQNFSGWARLKVRGTAGTEVQMRFAELVHEDGSLNPATNQSAEATDTYILKGDGCEIWEPKFTVHGFRYVEISGFPGAPTSDSIEGCVVHSDVAPTGEFSCSNELLNKIHRAVQWGQLSNLMSIPTDCPQRDERYGWLGDAHLSVEEAMFNFDMAAFYTKYLRDISDAQKPDGSLPDTVPAYLPDLFVYPTDPAWGTAYITIAWYMYQFYGDIGVLREHYDGMKKYVGFLQDHADGTISSLGKYGDWCPPGSIGPKKTPVEFTATWYYYHDVLHFAKIAAVLDEQEDARHYKQLADEIKTGFNKKFLKGDDQYEAHRLSAVDRLPNQTSQTLPLYLNMPPENRRAGVLQKLLHSVINGSDFHVDTGILGTRFLLDVLSMNEHTDVAYKIATQKTYPGWGYMISEGATTLWERWEKITGNSMNSHNHIMLGAIDAWFYRVLAGISLLEPGWRKIRLKPPILDDLNFASAKIDTVIGYASISWEKDESEFRLFTYVPVGATADVWLPRLWDRATIFESDTLIWKNGKPIGSSSIIFNKKENGYLRFEIGSGFYQFRIQEPD